MNFLDSWVIYLYQIATAGTPAMFEIHIRYGFSEKPENE